MSTSQDSTLFSGSQQSKRAGVGWRRRWSRRRKSVLALVVVAAAAGVGIAFASIAGSSSTPARDSSVSVPAAKAPPLFQQGGTTGAAGSPRAGAPRTVAEVRDPEEARSFPVSPETRARYHSATTPTRAADAFVASGALSTAQVRQELGHLKTLERSVQASTETVPGGDSVGGNGTIPIPPDVPAVVQRVIAGANEITDLPYVYGGGHASFEDNAYDCSGSVSYALAAGGLLSAPETSGELESWGAPGPGKWITVYANAGHVFMYVNIGGAWMRYDTVGRSGPFASRWQPDKGPETDAFVVRHWPGL